MTEATFPRVRREVSPRSVLMVAALGVFMAFLDSTIVSIAFPDMLASFPDADLSDLSWVFNVYNVVLAALLIPAGRIADIVGRRSLFILGVVIFTAASVVCAVAQSVDFLVAARGFQGLGAAIVIPASLGLILHAFPEDQRGQGIALWSATGALAAGIGPSIGGFLVTTASWRLVFLINVPIGMVVWWMARRTLVESRAPGRRAMPDLLGALFVAVAIGLLTLAIVQGPTWGWRDPLTLAALVAAVAAAVALVRRSRRHPSPIVDPELLRSRSVSAANLLTLVGSAGFFALGLANILYLMELWGYSAFVAGLAGTPAPFVAAITAALMGKIAANRDPRPFIAVGGAIWAAGPLLLAASYTTEPSYLTAYLPAAVILATGIGVTFPLVSAIAVANASGGRYAGAAAFNSSVRQVGAALGVAILVALVGQPGPDQVEAAFDRAWWFAAACFALVAVGALAIGRVDPVAPAESLAEGLLDARRQAPTSSTDRQAPRPLSHPHSPAAAVAEAPRSVAELLATVPMFASLSPETCEAVATRAKVVWVPAGRWVYRQGDAADALYVVRTGRIQVVDETPGREPVVVRELGAGSALGELALIRDSPRTAGVRARRDAHLIRVGRDDFEAILATSPTSSRALLRTLSDWLSAGRVAAGGPSSGQPTVIAVVALGESAAAAGIERELAERLGELVSISFVTRDIVAEGAPPGPVLSALLDKAEAHGQHVLLAGGQAGSGDWTQSCLRQADRILLVVDDSPDPAQLALWDLPQGADVVLVGGPADAGTEHLLATLGARATYRVRAGQQRTDDVHVMARRLTGRAIGLVMSGGGARSFTQLGVIEELRDSGLVIDRIGGTSMGAFIGALLAQGLTPEEIDARSYEEWVRHNPVGDFRFPRTSLIRGRRARAMLERNFPGAIEDLPRSFFATSVDLITARPIYLRRGALAPAVHSSMALPFFMEPVVHDGMLLLDGGLMDNLPTEAMAADGEGPVIAVDVSEPSLRSLPPDVQPEVPGLAETIYKVMLLSEADDPRRRSFADLYIRPDVSGVGVREFHMLDEMREAGRRAARTALATAPDSLFS